MNSKILKNHLMIATHFWRALPILVFLFSGHLHAAQKILITHENVDSRTAQAVLSAHREFISYSDFLENERPTPDAKNNLTAAFATAQEAFLSSDISDLETKWLDVIAFAYKADWDPSQQKMIQISFLRLAQISTTAEKTNSYILQAVQFNKNFEPDAKLFPPPLISQFETLRGREGYSKLLTQNFAGFTKLLINGMSYPLNSAHLMVTSGTKRFTWLSNTYTPVTQVMTLDDAYKFKPQKNPLIYGSCEHPQLNAEIKSLGSIYSLNGVYLGGCITDFKPRNLVDLPNKINNIAVSEPISIENKIDTAAPSEFYKKPNFWLKSAAIAAGSLLLYNAWQNSQADDSHSQRHGF